ncbi:MAG: hypothetical protein V1738_01480 [Patescibacteria group bacterium]
MSKFREITALLVAKPWLGGVIVFVLTTVLYSAVQWPAAFQDPDSYYHAGLAVLTAEQGTVLDFPWLPFTTLADSFADHHYLYHLLLVPFVRLFDPLVGLKIAAVLFGAAASAGFYLAARQLRLRPNLSLVFSLLLATSMNFMFRMNLAKAASLSVLLVLLGVAAVVRRSHIGLFVLGFVFVWTHGSWPLLVFVVGLFACADFFRTGKLRAPARLLGWTVMGLATGLVVNPYFPQNLEFYWYQTIHAALINYADVINVGMEWLPYQTDKLIPQNAAPTLLLALAAALALAARLWREQIVRPVGPNENDLLRRASLTKALAVGTAILFALALRSQRHIEYFVPFSMLFSAAWFDYLSRRYDLRRLWCLSFGDSRRLGLAIATFFCLLFPVIAMRDVYVIVGKFHEQPAQFAFGKYESVTDWMQLHLPPSAVIFHGDWADFPPLFYRAPEFRYLAGLDPTFFYLKDPASFATWREATAGRVRDISAVVRFYDSKYAFVTSDQTDLRRAIEADEDFELVYQDDEARVYMIFP